ncbi:hypothetical protein HC026_09455 [Lactobacillus sp. LC28-10]|uniref:Antitoxin VbhA domain-containing protein n=1 Tax=Secundilactobacillus angelensis TaxID=2722706 RepID=A0ABX1KYV9_9LACO|nr:hypothetical protein [Secundilactobacillus angelensis]MCH5462644.1 hypothetical protein [Secundilactobacillus angelensis]NLR19136.1 hypothetical protein [Secundilactobacillus angelensis]
MTNNRIRKKQQKKAIEAARKGSPQSVGEALSGYVDKKTFDYKDDLTTYYNSLTTDSK